MARASGERSSNEQTPSEQTALLARAKDLLKLAKRDVRAAEEAFEKIGFEQQLETALALSGDGLQDWLLLSEDCTELVRSLPPEHLHQSIQLIGEEDALPLLAAASSAQFQAMMDLEWFTGNKLDRKKVRRWIELLMELEPDEADEAMQGLDLNALCTYLRPRLKLKVSKDYLLLMVHLERTDLMDPDLFETRDDLTGRFLQFIYDVDRELFGELMSLLYLEEKEVVQADLYAGREDRMIRRGFPALAKAEALLLPLDARRYGVRWPPEAAAGEAASGALQRTGPAAPFLLHALAWGRSRGELGRRTERAFIRESAELANSLLLAHAKDVSAPGIKKKALAAVQVLASVGLEAITGGHLVAASEALRAMDTTELFRLGWSLTREVAQDAWRLAGDPRIEHAYLPDALEWLPKPEREAVREAEALMGWEAVAATGLFGAERPPEAQELLTWPRLTRLRQAVERAKDCLETRLSKNSCGTL